MDALLARTRTRATSIGGNFAPEAGHVLEVFLDEVVFDVVVLAHGADRNVSAEMLCGPVRVLPACRAVRSYVYWVSELTSPPESVPHDEFAWVHVLMAWLSAGTPRIALILYVYGFQYVPLTDCIIGIIHPVCETEARHSAYERPDILRALEHRLQLSNDPKEALQI